ncbi:MAG TPA: DNA cytosine methyltransferase [Microbacterium sp.]|nr:DNA cytosine methyltransferase [Microbacterium sp.]
MINLELFSCAGGMTEGFRRAGVLFDLAVDFTADHCDSYERNIGHRPVRMDVRDLLRMVRLGWRADIDLLVADPPCTPWSRAGKRLGTADERDMLEVTCDLIAALQPRRYLIGNVPGLDDGTNLAIVQRTIGGLAYAGYCVADFARLDAADYGVPQHRIRPFWFGHREGPCIQWPAPTHCDPAALATGTLPGHEQLRPWVTCWDALRHLEGDALGRPVKMRRREQNGPQHGSVAARPTRVVGTSNGNMLSLSQKHQPSQPSQTIGAKSRGNGACAMAMPTSKHPAATPGEPSPTIRAGGGHSGPQSSRVMLPDAPSTTVQAREDRVGSGSPVLEWPWQRPSTTVTADPNGRLPPPDAIILSELAATILQGFPEGWVFAGATKKARWSQIGQAMPIALAQAVATSVQAQDDVTLSQRQDGWSHGLPTPTDHGVPSWSPSLVGRDRSPQERRQDGQPTQEHPSDDETRALQTPHAEAPAQAELRGVR